jgi:hypothetical protein
MTVENAIEILSKMNMESHKRFSNEEKETITSLGMAGWSGDITIDDSRLSVLPYTIRKLVEVMTAKRIVQ